MDEVWGHYKFNDNKSIHKSHFVPINTEWIDKDLDLKWSNIKKLRKTITAALEIKRKEKEIGSSLEAGVKVYTDDNYLLSAIKDIDLAEISITSSFSVVNQLPIKDSFILEEEPNIGVVVEMAKGAKCQRSWRISEDVGKDPEYPTLSLRDAEAVREFMKLK
tara:strand:- start:325 stop:810 length:486 start_codon:yes stop_codon:yes gene_type:complete